MRFALAFQVQELFGAFQKLASDLQISEIIMHSNGKGNVRQKLTSNRVISVELCLRVRVNDGQNP